MNEKRIKQAEYLVLLQIFAFLLSAMLLEGMSFLNALFAGVVFATIVQGLSVLTGLFIFLRTKNIHRGGSKK